MLRTLTGRIVLAALLPLLLGVAALGLFVGVRFEAYHLARMHADLEREAELIARLLAPEMGAGQRAAVADLVLQLASARQEVDLHVVDRAGTVVGTGPRWNPAGLHAARSGDELRVALAGQTVRHVGDSFDPAGMFVAVPIRYDDQIVGAIHLSYGIEHLAALTREIRLTVLAAALVAGLFASLIALGLARSVTRPVEALSTAAARLADGHLAERVAEPPTVELGMLASGFNHLAARLEALEAARRSLLAEISHDLRAPVGAIQAATETLLAGAEEEPVLRHRLITGIGSEMQRLTRLTGDLLELARFEVGRLELRRRPVVLDQLVRGVVAAFEREAAERGVGLSAEVAPELPVIDADPDRLGQVLANLLTNALKFVPGGGRVKVTADSDGAHAVLTVSDTGPGIAPEDLPHIFDRFYQAGDSARRRVGLGLGLAIVRAIVEAHRGQVAVESQPGVGSSFTVLLPLGMSSDPPPASLPLTRSARS